MKKTTVFKNGASTQAVRIPKDFRIESKEVWIEQTPQGLLIRPKPESWEDFFFDTPPIGDDFDFERNQPTPQNRDDLFE